MHHYNQAPWNPPYAIVNNGRALSYGHPPKPELTFANHPLPSKNKKFDYSVPIMGQPSDHKKEHEDMRAAAKTTRIAEEAWREYRIRLQEWDDGERELRKKMAAKLPFEK